jgi:hypothetical protein
MTPHKIYISNKRGSEGQISTGYNTEVAMDGIALKGVKSIKYKVDAKGVGLVTMQIYAELDIDHENINVEIVNN